MQKLMSFVISATIFAYTAYGETVQKNADTTAKKLSSDTFGNQTESKNLLSVPKKK